MDHRSSPDEGRAITTRSFAPSLPSYWPVLLFFWLPIAKREQAVQKGTGFDRTPPAQPAILRGRLKAALGRSQAGSTKILFIVLSRKDFARTAFGMHLVRCRALLRTDDAKEAAARRIEAHYWRGKERIRG